MVNEIEPGSWRVVEIETTLMGMRRVEIWHNGLSIASLNMRHYPSALENGRRMAAAPDLIDALETLLGGCGFCECRPAMDCPCTNCRKAQTALAKARGEA